MSVVQEALNEFNEESLTYRLLKGVYTAVPYSPEFPMWSSVDDAVRALKPMATEAEILRARQMAESDPQVANIIWMARLLDAGDKGYAIVTGLASAWKLFQGQGSDALETDTQQRNDAVLKALGMAYMVYNAYPGSLSERANAFRTSPTGQALMVYYASIEVALPFADNAAMATSGALANLLSSQGGEQAQRLQQLAQGHNLAGAMEMLNSLTGQIQRVADHARNYITPISNQVAPYVPGAMDAADKAAGALANAADVMPVYRLLGGRLAAETAARAALNPPAPPTA